ncbi:MAG: branched-chain amino acid ABC transporter permease [Promethearchaeota archaeon]|jgi:branched-chain amino acid transport system permease protein
MIEDFLNFIILGSIQGSVYALLALGFSLVYGVGGVLNQAHGAFYLITMYIFFWFYRNVAGFGLVIGIIVGLVAVTLIAGLVYIVFVKPLKESHVGVVIVTFAFAFFMEQVVKVFVDSLYHDMPLLIPGFIEIFGVNVYFHYILIVVSSLSLLVFVILIINKSKIGKSIRAVAQDAEAAELMGINVDKILAYTLMISGFLAGVAAILYVPMDIVAPHIGWSILLNSFSIVVLGGLGSLSGSILGAFIISYANAFTNFVLRLPELSALIPVIVIVLMLIIRPRGLFGKKEID